MKVWIDIDNPPQVQYLLPFRRAFAARGAGVVVTARDYGATYAMLERAGVEFHGVGARFGASKLGKVTGSLRRAGELARLLGGRSRPDLVVCASRPAAMAARALGIPSFVLGDYEYADVASYRLTRSYFVFPDVIAPSAFSGRGIRADRLLPYRGIKEDITFSGVDLEAVVPDPVVAAAGGAGAVRVLFRPPAEDAHYYRSESGDLALALLEHLAREERAVVVLSPRYERQAEYLSHVAWRNEPLVLREPVPFVSLLAAVDLVVSSGGTMLREAAYMGVPAYSIFRSRVGGVDRHLEALGRLRFLSSPADFPQLRLTREPPQPVLRTDPHLVDRLAGGIAAVAAGGRAHDWPNG